MNHAPLMLREERAFTYPTDSLKACGDDRGRLDRPDRDNGEHERASRDRRVTCVDDETRELFECPRTRWKPSAWLDQDVGRLPSRSALADLSDLIEQLAGSRLFALQDGEALTTVRAS